MAQGAKLKARKNSSARLKKMKRKMMRMKKNTKKGGEGAQAIAQKYEREGH